MRVGPFDGHPLDLLSVGAALLAMAVRAVRMRRAGAAPTRAALLDDAIAAASAVPYAVLVASVAFSSLLDLVKEGSRLSFALAGLLGAVFSAAELAKRKP